MAVRNILILFLSLITFNGVAQKSLRLVVCDFSLESGNAALRNPITADSVGLQDDQPTFHPTDSLLYYVASNGKKSAIYSYDFRSGEKKAIAESEQILANPLITPDQKFISCLQQKSDKKFQLIKYPISGGPPVVLNNEVNFQSHLWIDDNAVLAIVDGDPNSLLLMTLRPKKAVPVAQFVGRVLQRSGKNFLFVHKLSVDSWSVKRINPDGSIDIMAETLPDTDLFVATSQEKIIMLSEGKLYYQYRPLDWKEVAFPQDMSGIRSIGLNSSGTKFFLLMETRP